MSSSQGQRQNRDNKRQEGNEQHNEKQNTEEFKQMKEKQREIFNKINENKNKQKELFNELETLKQQLTGRVQLQKNPDNRKLFDKIKELQNRSKEIQQQINEKKAFLPDEKHEFKGIRTVKSCLEKINELEYEYQTNSFTKDQDRKLKERIERLKQYSTQIAQIEKASTEITELQKERKDIQKELTTLYPEKEKILQETMKNVEIANSTRETNQNIHNLRDEIKQKINKLKDEEKKLYKQKDDVYEEYKKIKEQKQAEYQLLKQNREKIRPIIEQIKNLGVFCSQKSRYAEKIEIGKIETNKSEEIDRNKLINLLQQKLKERLEAEESGQVEAPENQEEHKKPQNTGRKQKKTFVEGFEDDALLAQFQVSKDELKSSERLKTALERIKDPNTAQNEEINKKRAELAKFIEELRALGADVVFRDQNEVAATD